MQLSVTVSLDWRADILHAVHDIFAKDLQAIHSNLRTYTLLHSADGSDALDALERTISAQVTLVPVPSFVCCVNWHITCLLKVTV